MQVQRLFTSPDASPYTGMVFEPRVSRITKLDGSVVFEAKDVMVPQGWEQVSVDILSQKYFRRAGLTPGVLNGKEFIHPDDLAAIRPQGEAEHDSRQTFHRIVGCWARWGDRFGYFDTDEDAQAFYDELTHMMARQMLAPNSPQWFNTGLKFAYGITSGTQGHFYVNHGDGVLTESADAYTHPQTSACFIQSINDDLVNPGGIMDLWVREARLFKYGSGSGTNFSNLRGSNEPLSGGGKSSGLMSFLKVGDVAAGSIKSGGTSRRAAKMNILNADHPDIFEFVNWKVREERKVVMLATGSRVLADTWKGMISSYVENGHEIDPKKNKALGKVVARAKKLGVSTAFLAQCFSRLRQGNLKLDQEILDASWDGEAYMTVSGMNANNSVRLTDRFMATLAAGGDWSTTRRVDGAVYETFPAKKLWDSMAEAAWMCADPGLQFDDTMNNWHTCLNDGRINATNPCSEYLFLDDTACNLASINLCAFLLPDGSFDLLAYQHACRLVTLALEITVAMSQFPTAEVAQRTYDYRTLGLGYANLGALLMRKGLPYDSEAGRTYAAALTAIMTGTAYGMSAEMAQQMGPFPRFEANKDNVLKVIRNHAMAAFDCPDDFVGLNPRVKTHTLKPLTGSSPAQQEATLLVGVARAIWDQTQALVAAHGVRNAQVTVLAPTGTIGLVMACDTTGVEPDFALVKFKKLAGGGYFKLVNQGVPLALSNLGYDKNQIQDIIDYATGMNLRQAIRTVAKAEPTTWFSNDLLDELEAKLITSFDASFTLPMEDFVAAFGEENTQRIVYLINGTGTVEGAPWVKNEHLAIFDCANKCGKGTRFIAPEGHLQMMAAIQPFLSGAISKTINMPGDASIEDVEKVHMDAWKNGVKAIALYRDGSKMSQAMSTNLDLLDGLDALEEDAPVAEKVQVIAAAMAKKVLTNPEIATRVKLPARRSGYTQAASISGTKLYIRTGEYENGQLGEIFLDMHKEGAAFRSMMNAFAIAISIGLQYGVPLEEYCDAFLFTKFEPQGPITGHPALKMTTSVIDYIFRDLAITYLGRQDLAHVKTEDLLGESGPAKPMARLLTRGVSAVIETEVEEGLAPTPAPRRQLSHQELGKAKGYLGDPCPTCGHFTLLRNGTCMKCDTCGSTTGCS